MKILIVDDSKAMRLLIKRILRQVDIDTGDIVEACDGQEGLASALSEEPDLIISDWNMPNMTGIEFLRALRAKGVDTTFGFVTTETSREMRQLATDTGAQFMIGKPFTPDSFESILKPVINS